MHESTIEHKFRKILSSTATTLGLITFLWCFLFFIDIYFNPNPFDDSGFIFVIFLVGLFSMGCVFASFIDSLPFRDEKFFKIIFWTNIIPAIFWVIFLIYAVGGISLSFLGLI